MIETTLAVQPIAQALVESFREWRAGPETDGSLALRDQIDEKERQLDQLKSDIQELERQRLEARARAKTQQPSWWRDHADAISVNIVAGLIVSVPMFGLGVVVTLLLKS